jgi:hypothetical protein
MFLTITNIQIIKITILLPALFVITFASKAGDTIFSNPPDTRYWNTEYMQEVFLDDFNENHINTDVWAFDLCKSRGYNGNNEGEPNNVKVSDGSLKLTVLYDPGNIDTNCWENTNFVSDYTTAEITTQWDRFKYGCFEAKCLMPRGDHFYYAYWLWGPGGEGYPSDGFASEIDIAEGTEWRDGTNHDMKTTVHYWSNTEGEIGLPKDWTYGYGTQFEGDWHVYKLIWNPFELVYYVDDTEIWRRSKYYTEMDTVANDVGMDRIVADSIYQVRDYFPHHHMQTTFQMHIQDGVTPEEIPVAMEVEYVKVKQFFLAPEIECPDVVFTEDIAKLDVDSMATNISWQLSPAYFFKTPEGNGVQANIVAEPDSSGMASILYTFNMPSGEIFSASHEFLLEKDTVANSLSTNKNNAPISLLIHPNPASNTATIALDGEFYFNEEWNLEIYNLGGQLMMKKINLHDPVFKINLSDWKKGVYLVRANSRKHEWTGKLVVGE